MNSEHAEQLTAGFVRKGLMRKLVERPLRALGVEAVPTWDLSAHAHGYVHAELLRELFAEKSIDCVFDVGAFIGDFGRFLRERVGFRGTILSFEPQPEPFRVLEHRSRHDPRWHVFPTGLGAQRGELVMNVMNKPLFSSFLAPIATMPRNMVERNTVVSTISVRIETVADRYDELSSVHRFTRPFLKMDTQGFDLQVLEGALPQIRRFRGLQSELSLIPIYVGMPDWNEALTAYQKAGFALSGFFPVSRDEQLRAVELDAVMVRNEPAT
jgi:FkbM family methyltransferase